MRCNAMAGVEGWKRKSKEQGMKGKERKNRVSAERAEERVCESGSVGSGSGGGRGSTAARELGGVEMGDCRIGRWKNQAGADG